MVINLADMVTIPRKMEPEIPLDLFHYIPHLAGIFLIFEAA
jgi:hypothetical protein